MSLSPTLQACLRNKGSQYEVVHHPYTHSSIETVASAHVPGECLAKTVLFEDEHGYVAAVLPATHAVRLSELRAKTGRRLILAKEADLRRLFNDCDVGAAPPVSTAYGMQTYLDETLTRQPEIYFEAGDHQALVHMNTNQFLDLMDQAKRTHFAHRMQSYSI